MEDVLEMDEDDELEEEADAEVDKVLFELTDGKLGQVGAIKDGLPVRISVILRTWIRLMLSIEGGGGPSAQRRDGTHDGEIPPGVEWDSEQLIEWMKSCIWPSVWSRKCRFIGRSRVSYLHASDAPAADVMMQCSDPRGPGEYVAKGSDPPKHSTFSSFRHVCIPFHPSSLRPVRTEVLWC